ARALEAGPGQVHRQRIQPPGTGDARHAVQRRPPTRAAPGAGSVPPADRQRGDPRRQRPAPEGASDGDAGASGLARRPPAAAPARPGGPGRAPGGEGVPVAMTGRRPDVALAVDRARHSFALWIFAERRFYIGALAFRAGRYERTFPGGADVPD